MGGDPTNVARELNIPRSEQAYRDSPRKKKVIRVILDL